MSKPDITIIGLGQVGTALLRALNKKGYSIKSVYNRTEAPSSLQKEMQEVEFYTGLPFGDTTVGDIIFLTIADDAIKVVSSDLKTNFTSLDEKTVVHCSGAYSSQVLSGLKERGARVASFHPMQAITKSTQTFVGTWFDMDGDEEALVQLEAIALQLGGKTFRVEPGAKPLLHASAVVASNYLVVLADMVSKMAKQAGIDEDTALKAITPLMDNTLENIRELGVTDALTGPIARGDVNTVAEHLKTLNTIPEVLSLYKILGKEAVHIAEQKTGKTESLAAIKELLS